MTAGIWNISVEAGATFNPVLTWQTDYRSVDDAVMTASQAGLVSNKAIFSAADVGKSVTVQGAGVARGPLATTIAAFVNATSVTLSASATFAVTNANCSIYSPLDLSGFTAKMTVNDRSGNLVISLTTENGGLTLGASAGTITLLISAANTGTLPVGSHVYDMDLISGAGIVTKLVKGSFDVLKEVTA